MEVMVSINSWTFGYLYVVIHYKCSVVSSDLMIFFFQAEDGIRYLVRSRGLGDVYKRQVNGT